LLPIVAIEEAVFRRCPLPGDGKGGEDTVSLGWEVFRESHEKGLVNFRVVGGAGGGLLATWAGGGGGGGDHGIDGRAPERP
jgi:hypothetical protein